MGYVLKATYRALEEQKGEDSLDANLQSDSQVIESFLRSMMDVMMEAIHQNSDATSRMAEALMRHYKTHGDLEFRVIPAAYSQEIIDKLTLHRVPFMYNKNSAGDITLILPPDKKHGNDYGQYIEEVFMHHPEYYRQLDKGTWTRLARADGEREVIAFTFANPMDAEIFKNKAFADGKGLVTTDINNKDGSVTVYCRESDLINDERNNDAISALIDAEYSLEEPYQAFARRYAVYHDKAQVDDCMQMMEDNIGFVIHDGANKRTDYLQFKDNKLTYYRWDSNLNKFMGTPVDVDRSNPDAMRKLFDYHVSHIHNEHVSTIEEFKTNFERHSESFIKETYIEKQKLMYSKVILPTIQSWNATNFEDIVNHPSFQASIKAHGLEDIRPDFSVDFLQLLKQEKERDLETFRAKLNELEGQIEKEDHVLDEREDSFRQGLQEQGLARTLGCDAATTSLDEIQNSLLQLQEKVRDTLSTICHQRFGAVPTEDPKRFLQTCLSKGIDVPHFEKAVKLCQKEILTPEEEKELESIAQETLFVMAAKEDAQASRGMAMYLLLRGDIREVSGILDSKQKTHKAHSTEQTDIQHTIKEQKNLIVQTQKHCKKLDMLIQNEEKREVNIKALSEGCHQVIRDLKARNPNLSSNAILREVKQFMKAKGFDMKHANVSAMDFDNFEQKVERVLHEEKEQEQEQEKTQEHDGPGSER